VPPPGSGVLAPYDAPMDAGSVVSPPHVARPLRLLPFRGLTLAPSRIGALSSVRAFTRPYRDVAARLERWERRGQVTRDPEPAVYLHEYTVDGMTVRGLVGALDISRRADSRAEVAVFPHEGIHPAQADELADRMSEMQINPAPILLVHEGTAQVRRLLDRVQTRSPHLEFSDRGRQRHRVWALREPADLDLLERELEPAQALIADGHHRYAAYLRMQRLLPGTATDAGLAMLVDQADTPLFLGAIHRVLVGATLEALHEAATAASVGYHALDPGHAVDALAPDTLVATDGRAWAGIRLHADPDRTAVEMLHQDVLTALAQQPTRIEHHHAVEDALGAVQRRRGVAVLMPAPDFGQVLRICESDRLLPEKATSFQPKPSVGVLIRSLRDG
jgi:uncharacterized protein (DUF1015 family)